MNETFRLELDFENELGKSKRLTIRRPVDGLTEEEILPVMQTIIDNDIFDDDGFDPYQKASGARYVRTNVEDVFSA